MRYRYIKEGTNTINLVVYLVQGTTTIASWTHNDIAATYTDAEQTLTSGEADSITNYSDLRVRFEATQV